MIETDQLSTFLQREGIDTNSIYGYAQEMQEMRSGSWNLTIDGSSYIIVKQDGEFSLHSPEEMASAAMK